MKKVSIVGIVGVPASYGGFESLVENIIGENCSDNIEYSIYCSSKSYKKKVVKYKKATLHYIPLKANGIQSSIYDIIALVLASFSCDTILILGVSGCCFLPIFRLFSNKKLIINIDGLEHKRDKWGKWTRKFLKFSEHMAIRYANIVISDNKGIQDYVREEYNGYKTQLIAYGGDHALCSITKERNKNILNRYNLCNKKYSFSVCRIEPENNVHITLEAFAESGKELVFVGNWEKNDYGKTLLNKYNKNINIHLLSPIYDVEELYVLRSNCIFYIHGHSAGGTNPSLVEAMFFSKPILAFNVIYNRETTEQKADYFNSTKELISLLNRPYAYFTNNSLEINRIANRTYRWSVIAKKYEELY